MTNPLVSIGIPTYNNAKYIEKTIKSVIKQTYQNIEIVICDNASTDNTEEVVKSIKDSRIKYYKNDKTVFPLANWNLCIKKASGDYIAIYHSDDIYEPTIVEEELNFLLKNPEVGAVFCLDTIIDEYDKPLGLGVKLPPEMKHSSIFNFNEIFFALLQKSGSFLIAPTFMAKKSIFQRVGFFREDKKFGDSDGSAADTEMWIRISEFYDLGILPKRLIKRRISSTQGSTCYESSRTKRANHFLVLDHYLEKIQFKIPNNILAQYEYNKFWDDVIIAKNFIKKKNYKAAKHILIKTFSIRKFATGFRKLKNFAKMIIYVILLFSLVLGLGKWILRAMNYLKK